MLHAEVEGDAAAVEAAIGVALGRPETRALDLVSGKALDDREETADRSRSVMHALESCHEELVRLEMIPTQDADDINAISAAKGYVARARNALRGRFA